ncbi:YaaC family protein [Candidatus Poriferisocius sp.]|uniref:YaaC family protein n=1 Tax=Candidatus Poriferisocius sp. TaxID=3101276 RepID=UPI003B5BF0D3
MAAPPSAREGKPGWSKGRLIVAGVAPHARLLSHRASSADLWSSLDAFAVEGAGIHRLQSKHGTNLDAEAGRRFISYIKQAKEYFEATANVGPVSKPLLAYYFALNLTKAFLTAIDPATTKPDFIHHGASAKFVRKRRYRIEQESFTIGKKGVFHLLASRTGAKFCHEDSARDGKTIALLRLLPYLPEACDLYTDSTDRLPKLLPITSCYPLFANKKGWLRVEIDRNTLRRHKLKPESVLKSCQIFGGSFRLVQSPESTVSYESTAAYTYGRSTQEAAPKLCSLYDKMLMATDRSYRGPRRYLVISDRTDLHSHEAVAFLILLHLSNMVRYRPQDVERLRATRYFWLFSSWVDRACESYLLNLSSRITGEEHFVD